VIPGDEPEADDGEGEGDDGEGGQAARGEAAGGGGAEQQRVGGEDDVERGDRVADGAAGDLVGGENADEEEA